MKSENTCDSFLINVAQVLDYLNVHLSHNTNETIRSQISKLIQNYSTQRIKTINFKLSIHLEDVTCHLNSETPNTNIENVFVEKQISDVLEKGIIRKSTSNFSSPTVLVKMKKCSHRLCVDIES